MQQQPQDPPVFELRGPKVHVYKSDRLYLRPFLRPRRIVIANLRGTQLTVNYHYLNKSVTYELYNAKLSTFPNALKIVLDLVNEEKLCFFAHNMEEFQSWNQALTDCIEWNIERFYELKDTLGEGAFATVVRGVHRETHDVVAIKVITKTLCNRQDIRYLQREIDIHQSLKHKNIVRMSDLFDSTKNLYIVLEYLDGGTLRRFVASNAPISEQNARGIMRDILSGVQYLHSNHVVHRDIKVSLLLKIVDSSSRIGSGAGFFYPTKTDIRLNRFHK